MKTVSPKELKDLLAQGRASAEVALNETHCQIFQEWTGLSAKELKQKGIKIGTRFVSVEKMFDEIEKIQSETRRSETAKLSPLKIGSHRLQEALLKS